jgi:hypothetical protein
MPPKGINGPFEGFILALSGKPVSYIPQEYKVRL